MTRREVELLGLALLLLGCAVASPPVLADDCRSVVKPAVLIRNPDAPPPWVWVSEDQIPTSGRTLLFGKAGELAPPEILAAHPPPPCGAPVSVLHRGESPPESEGMRALGIFGILLQFLGRGF